MFNKIFIHRNPVWFIPNILDYIRVVLLIVSSFFIYSYPWLTVALFALSGIFDGLDGSLAKLLKQESRLGAVLDFSIDRAEVAYFMLVLTVVQPKLWGLFCGVLVLDIGSHFALCYVSAMQNIKHLDMLATGSILIQNFGQKRVVRYLICTSFTLFFGLFFFNYIVHSDWWIYIGILAAPGMLLKNWIHVEQGWLALSYCYKSEVLD